MSAAENTRIFDCFKVGRHTAMSGNVTEWNESDLEQICRNYPLHKQAPLVLGHPIVKGQVYGWVKDLFHKRGVLYAVAVCGSALIDLVRRGAYKNRSCAFTQPGAFGLQGRCLDHIGLLGAASPAVMGLSPLQFASRADSSGVICFAGQQETRARAITLESWFITPPAGWRFSPESLSLYRRALEVHADCPALSFAEAASLAERYT